MNPSSILHLQIYLILLKHIAGRESCPYEPKRTGFRMGRTCYNFISAERTAIKRVYDSNRYCESHFKDGRLFSFLMLAEEELPPTLELPGRAMITGWTIKKQASFEIRLHDADDIVYHAVFEKATFDGEVVGDVEVTVNSDWVVTSTGDLKADYFSFFLLLFGPLERFPLCNTVVSEGQGRFTPGSIFSCSRKPKPSEMVCCLSGLYRDCQGKAFGACKPVPGEKRCFMKYDMIITAEPEPPYGRCVYNDIVRDEPCSCVRCDSYWSYWSDYDSVCGDSFRRRFRPSRAHPYGACQNYSATCCAEAEMEWKGECPCARATLACQNGGTCVDVNDDDWKCLCVEGYTGHLCELEVSSCYDVKCLNGGTCVEQFMDFECSCQAGYSGRYCQRETAGPRTWPQTIAILMIVLSTVLTTALVSLCMYRIVKKKRKDQSWISAIANTDAWLTIRGGFGSLMMSPRS